MLGQRPFLNKNKKQEKLIMAENFLIVQTLKYETCVHGCNLQVYGILQSVRRFPVYKDITANCDTSLGTWLQEMDKVAGKQSRE